MRRLAAMVCASLVLAGLLLVPLAAGVSAATASAAGFPCDPHGTTGGSPTTTLSSVRIDTTTPANSQLTCLFRGTRLPLSTGGACSFDGAAFHVDFSRRTLLPVNNNTNLICSGGTVTPKTDLAISKDDGEASATPGLGTGYSITVTNNGPTAVTGASLSDPLPAGVTSATWSFVGETGGGVVTGPTSGSGALATTLNLPVGATVTFNFSVQISPSATGSLVNTATIAAPAGVTDTNTANNSATDTDDLTPRFDVSVTADDGITSIPAGATATYTAVFANAGPSTAPVETAGVVLGSPAFDFSGLPATLTLAPGTSQTFTVTAVAGSTGLMIMTVGDAIADTNVSNNFAQDIDTIIPIPG